MSVKDSFFYINIRDYLALGNDNEAGEPELVRTILEFSCPQTVFHNLIPVRRKVIRQNHMSWYSFYGCCKMIIKLLMFDCIYNLKVHGKYYL